jgi:proline iminopeptidase
MTETRKDEVGEHSPLLRHFSMDETGSADSRLSRRSSLLRAGILLACLASLLLLYSLNTHQESSVIPIENAQEHYIEVDDGVYVWFRIWGNKDSGVPVLFVHGGPGQSVADYSNGNKRFFQASECFVIEVDQRGTGRSQPSVRDDWKNMELYQNISIDLISKDFEVIRKHLDIDQWLVWGGSFGSTIALDYGMQFPESCLALILRGIYLDTVREVDSVYSRNAFRYNNKRLAEFDILYKLANDHIRRHGKENLDPNDALSLMQVYENMISKGREEAIWNWFVFENNLMEEKPENLLDPNTIDETRMPEAQSVAFFETRLWIHASLEEPSNLIQRVDRLSETPIWMCQGRRDEVCPPENAQHLAQALEQAGAPLTAQFIDSGHEDTDPVMEACLKESMSQFLASR